MNKSLAAGDCASRTPALAADACSAEVPNRILIVEDETVVALNLADLVTDAGFLALGPAASASEAVRALDQSRPHAAILDMVLKDGVATCVAMELASRGKRRGRLGSVMALAGRCRFGEGNRMSSAGSAWATVLALALASGAISPPFCRTAPGMISSSPSATPLLPCSSVQPRNESLLPYRCEGLIVAFPTAILTNGTRSASRSPHRRRSALDPGNLAI